MTLTPSWCFRAYHCFLCPLFPRGFTFPHRFAMSSSPSHCSWESLLCPHTWAVLAEQYGCTFWNYSQVLLGFDFCLIITHSWLVFVTDSPMLGLDRPLGCPGDGIVWVMWHGLGCLSTLSYPFNYFFSSRISRVCLSHWGCMKVLK